MPKTGKINLKQKELRSTGDKKKKAVDQDPGLFPIAGIGASAGGLEALEQFLINVPDKSGLAYVIIQHLDPTQKGMLPELLQRVTKMKVFQVKDRMKVKPDCVYVIPPNKSMSVLNGTLYLFKPVEVRGLRLPVDFFLRSLAEDRKELSIGIILSGMGSDGSAGLRAIKEKNGIVMVQDPASAKFDSMPHNAIHSVMVDIVAPANELAEKLLNFIRHYPRFKSGDDPEIKDKNALEKIIILLRSHTGNDFTLYKKNTLYRRVERRMGVHKIAKISSYITLLQDNPKEVEILFKELLIGVTSFFRDASVWKKLENEIIPQALTNLTTGSNLRAWVAGCSTGEEAYSLAIIFKEALGKIKAPGGISLQIFATDLDNDAIEFARKGLFPVNIASDVPPDLLTRYFVKTNEGFRVKSEIRETIVFAQHNIIMHPPFTRIDILSCRNLLIYLDAELQKKILRLFYYSLNHDGLMLLGNSETLGAMGHYFSPVDAKLKMYKRSSEFQVMDIVNFPSSYRKSVPDFIEKINAVNPDENIQSLAEKLLLKYFAPPGVLVNEAGDIIFISGHTGKYLEPAAGKANLNIFAMLREGLRTEFPLAFQKAIREKEPVVLRNLVVGTNGGSQSLNITIQCIDMPESLKGTVMIIFSDVQNKTGTATQTKSSRNRLSSTREAELEKELQNMREQMQGTIEAMQATQEELKSANEELQSSNEELQSTNEELTSSKEEMQSLNEELQTVNAELQTKVDEFARVDNDMKNLLDSTDIATLFIDKDLNIRRFTNQATKLFKFIKSDIGRPFTDQVSDLDYPEMADDAIEVLRSLISVEKQIPGKDGQWFSIRIMPYRTFDDRIDGLVITFINISNLKKVEEKLNESEQIKSYLYNSSSEIIIKLSSRYEILEFNPGAEKFFGIKCELALDKNYMEMFVPEPVRTKTIKAMDKLFNDAQDSKIKIKVKAAGTRFTVVEWTVKMIMNNLKKPLEMLLIGKA